MPNDRSDRPNILIILIDDMGVHQLGCYGNTFYETPHLDRLAEQGIAFNQAYGTAPVCSPSRAGLYTGKHPARLHLTNYIPGTEPANARLSTPKWTPFLPAEEDTMGDHFKRAGYRTAHFGKWHLAVDYNYRPGRPTDPESHGFDRVVYTRKPKPDADPEADPHHIDELTDKVCRYLAEKDEAPFLCVLAHNAIHRPEMAPRALIEHFTAKPGSEKDCNRPVLAAMVSHLDTSIGRVVDALEASGHADSTIVVFTADHGAFGKSMEHKPLRGAKADLYEGGIRVPLIIRLPGSKPKARWLNFPTANTDLLPTLAELAGVSLPASPDDGQSLSPVFKQDQPPEPRDLFWHFPHYHHQGLAPCGAVRHGRYKLIEWFEGSIGTRPEQPRWELFDLGTDPYETNNLALRLPEVCADLRQRLEEWRRKVGAQAMVPNPNFDPDLIQAKPPPPPGDPVSPYES
ncbi:MAG: sulfatase [Opitutaceae bacterium]